MKNYRMNWLTCITCLFLALSTQAVAQNGNNEWPKADYQVVPLPSRINLLQKEDFVLNAQTLIVVGSDNVDMQRNGRFLQQYIEEETGLRLSLSAKVEKGRSIVLRLNQKMLEPEGYRMTVDRRGVTIEGMTPQGVFYGISSFQLQGNASGCGAPFLLVGFREAVYRHDGAAQYEHFPLASY